MTADEPSERLLSWKLLHNCGIAYSGAIFSMCAYHRWQASNWADLVQYNGAHFASLLFAVVMRRAMVVKTPMLALLFATFSVAFAYDEYVMKFGGSPWTCNDGTFWDGTNTPAAPLVRIDVIYGGCGDKDASQNKKDNVGIFKQRFQGRMADVKVVSSWTPPYATQADRDRDSLTLPVQTMESGDRVNGGFKMNGYHPTEQKFPGDSLAGSTLVIGPVLLVYVFFQRHFVRGLSMTGLKA